MTQSQPKQPSQQHAPQSLSSRTKINPYGDDIELIMQSLSNLAKLRASGRESATSLRMRNRANGGDFSNARNSYAEVPQEEEEPRYKRHHPTQCLILWPTVPVPEFKGSDSRPLNAATLLSYSFRRYESSADSEIEGADLSLDDQSLQETLEKAERLGKLEDIQKLEEEVDSISESLGCAVDLAYHHDFRDETRSNYQTMEDRNTNSVAYSKRKKVKNDVSGNTAGGMRFAYNDATDRERVHEAGIRSIYGPGADALPVGDIDYDLVLLWAWPDVSYLKYLREAVRKIKMASVTTSIMTIVDDVGLAPRMLVGKRRGGIVLNDAKNKESNSRGKPVHEIQGGMGDIIRWISLPNRPHILVGADNESSRRRVWGDTSSLDHDFEAIDLWRGKRLTYEETFLYVNSDILGGLGSNTIDYFRRMTPSTPAHRLSYVAPMTLAGTSAIYADYESNELDKNISHKDRSGILFFGYSNPANEAALEWFGKEVLPRFNKSVVDVFHIAGAVDAPSLCNSSCQKRELSSPLNLSHITTLRCSDKSQTGPQVICYGPLSDEDLNTLIKGVRVCINPVLEPSGVATKTIRSLGMGTPVVASTFDGTFDVIPTSDMTFFSMAKEDGAVRCPVGSALCMSNSINLLVADENVWNTASESAKKYSSDRFGPHQYSRDWLSLLNVLNSKKREILILGDVVYRNNRAGGGMNSASEGVWHFVDAMQSRYGYILKFTVVGALHPSIDGVIVKSRKIELKSHYATGYQAHVVIRMSWPNTESSVPISVCGVGCRVIEIVPWDFWRSPRHQWMAEIRPNMDWFFVTPPSEKDRSVGYDIDSEPPGFNLGHIVFIKPHYSCSMSTKNEESTTCLDKLVVEYKDLLFGVMESPAQRSIEDITLPLSPTMQIVGKMLSLWPVLLVVVIFWWCKLYTSRSGYSKNRSLMLPSYMRVKDRSYDK